MLVNMSSQQELYAICCCCNHAESWSSFCWLIIMKVNKWFLYWYFVLDSKGFSEVFRYLICNFCTHWIRFFAFLCPYNQTDINDATMLLSKTLPLKLQKTCQNYHFWWVHRFTLFWKMRPHFLCLKGKTQPSTWSN